MTLITCYGTPQYQLFSVVLLNARPALQPPVVLSPQVTGYYWVRSSNGTAVQVYCDMDRVCGCNSTSGWARVAYLNISDPSQQCPDEWTLQAYSSESSKLCGKGSSGVGCISANYNTFGIRYNHVCGRVIGCQIAYTDAFGDLIDTIEGSYICGWGINHTWTSRSKTTYLDIHFGTCRGSSSQLPKLFLPLR